MSLSLDIDLCYVCIVGFGISELGDLCIVDFWNWNVVGRIECLLISGSHDV